MLNTTYCEYLAGNPQQWDNEILAKVPQIGSCFESESLCSIQVSQHARGRKEATIWNSVFGWVVGLASNLDYNRVVCGGRHSTNRLTKEQAIEAGIAWANQDPEHRSFYVNRRDLIGTPWDAKDL